MPITRRVALPAIVSLVTSPLALVHARSGDEPNGLIESLIENFLAPTKKVFFIKKDNAAGKFYIEVEKDEVLEERLRSLGLRGERLKDTITNIKSLAEKFNRRIAHLKHEEIKIDSSNFNAATLETFYPKDEDFIETNEEFKKLLTVDENIYPLKVLKISDFINRQGYPLVVPAVKGLEFNPDSIKLAKYVYPYDKEIIRAVSFELTEVKGKNKVLVSKYDLPLVIITDKVAYFIGLPGELKPQDQNKQKKREIPGRIYTV